MIKPIKWQRNAMSEAVTLANQGKKEMFVSAGTGAGKTLAGLFIHQSIGSDVLLVVTTKTGIRGSWAKDARLLGLSLTVVENAAQLEVTDSEVLVVNVQKLRNMESDAIDFCKARNVTLIVDEAHHYGEGNKWTEAIQSLAPYCQFCIGMSATPMRSDRRKLIFMDYKRLRGRYSIAAPSIDYAYHEAVRDGLVAPVIQRFMGGTISKVWDNGRTETFSFEDGDYSEAEGQPMLGRMAERLRVATVESMDWQMSMIERARESLLAFREDGHPWAGLIICKTVEQAKNLAAEIESTWGDPTSLIVGNVDTATAVREFEQDSRIMWCVSITKVSEGISIDRLRVGALLAPVKSPPFLDQVRGRLSRLLDGVSQIEKTSALYLPADPRIIDWATARNRMVVDAAPWLAEGGTANDYKQATAEISEYSDVVLNEPLANELIKGIRDKLTSKPPVENDGSYTLYCSAVMAGTVVEQEFIPEAAYVGIRSELGQIIGELTAARASDPLLKILNKAFL